MTDKTAGAESPHTSEQPTPRAPGGDPYAAALEDNPYTVLPELDPDASIREVLLAMQRLQRRTLKPQEDTALRTLRDISSRLSWDLWLLGTTPGVETDEWQRTRDSLAAGRRDEALRWWLEKHGGVKADAALHVRAVLAANEVAWQTRQQDGAEDPALRRFVACWAALLGSRDWLASFVRQRCRVWGARVADAADQSLFLDKVERAVLEMIERGAGGDERRRAHWSAIWARERAAIRVVAKSCGKKGVPPRWSAGYGPLGLADLGEEEQARGWLLTAAKANRWPLPLTALREGKAGFFKLDPKNAAMAAAAVQWLFSSLGLAAAEVWNGNGRHAHESLRRLIGEHHRAGGELVADPWFGETAAGRRHLERAMNELRSEALLLQLQEELSRPEVPVSEVSETAGLLLFHTASLHRSQVVVNSLEALVSGRLRACIDTQRLPHPDEVQRIIDLSLEVRSMLLGRNAGQRCSTDIAQLIKNRAVAAWNRAPGGLPRPTLRHRILQELFQAADLAPHRAEIIANLVRVILKVRETAESPAERENLLNKARQNLEKCKALGGSSPELEECWNEVWELIDPAAARAETLEGLEKALGISFAKGPPSGAEGSGHG